MDMTRHILLLPIFLVFAGCASPGVHVSDSKDAWITVGRWGHEELLYCRANAGEKDAHPVCYKPERP